MRVRRAILAGSVVVVAACGTSASPPPRTVAGPGLPLPTSDWASNSSMMGATLNALLVRDGNCIRAREDGGAGLITVIWPQGFSARDAGAELEVTDAQGLVVARTGSRVAYTGGAIDLAPHPNPCTDGQPSGYFWEVNSELAPLSR